MQLFPLAIEILTLLSLLKYLTSLVGNVLEAQATINPDQTWPWLFVIAQICNYCESIHHLRVVLASLCNDIQLIDP
jgi:hypothetical protein